MKKALYHTSEGKKKGQRGNKHDNQSITVTNNLNQDNQILDVKDLKIDDPLMLEQNVNLIPGVLDNGIFARCKPKKVIVGKD